VIREDWNCLDMKLNCSDGSMLICWRRYMIMKKWMSFSCM